MLASSPYTEQGKKDEVMWSQDDRPGSTEGLAPDGMSGCLILVFKVTEQSWPWFKLVIKSADIHCGRAVMRERPGS